MGGVITIELLPLKFLSLLSTESNAMDEEDHELVFMDASKKKRSRLATCACVSGIGGAVFCFLTTVGLAIALAIIVSRHEHHESCPVPVCRTESCKDLASTVAAAMDTSVDPCDDFYAFSCGGWVKANPIPPGRSRYSPFDQLDERNKEALIEILEGDEDSDIEAVRKLRTV